MIYKTIIQHLVTFLIGAGAAMCLCLTCNPIKIDKGKGVLVQSDTTEKIVYVTYGGLDLKRQTRQLDLSKFDNFKISWWCYIPKDSVRIEYRDSGKIEYVVLPRKAYHTQMSDIDIYHSGVDSSIDSVAFRYNQQTITEQWMKKPWKHEVSIFASAGYGKQVRVPVGIEYTYYPKRWIGVGGKVEHDLISGCTGVYAKTNIRIGW